MAVWHVVVLYFAIFVLLQFAAYRYLRGRKDRPTAGPGSRSNPDPGRFDDRRSEPTVPRDDPDGARFCPRCGARNDAEQAYAYCRHCASPLGR